MKYLIALLLFSASAKGQGKYDSLKWGLPSGGTGSSVPLKLTGSGNWITEVYSTTFIVYPCNMCTGIRVDGYVINEYDPKNQYQVKVRYVDLKGRDLYRGRFKNAKINIWKP